MKQPLTVSALNKYLKYCFDHDQNLQNIYLKGEISNFKHHSRGHYYFTLKDESSQISTMMFSKHTSKVQFKCEDGMKVIVEGYVSLYLQGGSYQIYVTNIILDGLGDLYVRFEQLKEKLLKEGLFDSSNKLPLPKFPNKIGVITSDTGAAIRDIITTIERRYPLCEVVVFPTLVQGEYAKDDIVRSINKANHYPGIDLIILGRGGGSIEDLWCFNEEVVAYAIYHSKIPIISAVGHETDFTISDYVSDLRAATPTAASELAVPNKEELLNYLSQTKKRMSHIMNNLVKNRNQILNKLGNSYVFINPSRLYEQNYYKLDKLYANLEKSNPLSFLSNQNQKLEAYKDKLDYSFDKNYQRLNNQFLQLISKLELVNPLSLLQKGYSMVKKENKPISSIKELKIEDLLNIYLKDGIIHCEVKDKEVKRYD
ncbi:exodeoxyribonuclease VII large subunit [Mycoplasmatota bacterium]|nr:exodeoxyribonuclease VII large subunit [Mycoplasmatota bacterium]